MVEQPNQPTINSGVNKSVSQSQPSRGQPVSQTPPIQQTTRPVANSPVQPTVQPAVQKNVLQRNPPLQSRPLVQSSPSGMPQRPVVAQNYPKIQNPPKKNKWWLWLVFGIFVLIVGLIVLLVI